MSVVEACLPPTSLIQRKSSPTPVATLPNTTAIVLTASPLRQQNAQCPTTPEFIALKTRTVSRENVGAEKYRDIHLPFNAASPEQVNIEANSKQQDHIKGNSGAKACPELGKVAASQPYQGLSLPVSRTSRLQAARFAYTVPACVLDYTIINMAKTNITRVPAHLNAPLPLPSPVPRGSRQRV